MAAVDLNKRQGPFQDSPVERNIGIDLTSSPASVFEQQVRTDRGFTRKSYTLAFPGTSTLGQRNRIFIPSMNVIADDLHLQFIMPAPGTATNPYYLATYKWVNSGGITLYYKNAVVVNISQAELEMLFFLNNSPKQLRSKMLSHNDNPGAGTGASSAGSYHIDLSCLARIMRHCGSLAAYDANAWSIEIDLKSGAGITSGSDGDTTAGSASITALNLVITGPEPPIQFAEQLRSKLNSTGFLIHYLQGNYQRDNMADNAGSSTAYSISLNQLEGNVAAVMHLVRLVSVVDAATTAGSGAVAAQLTGELVFGGNSDYYDLGTSANPDEFFGKQMILAEVQDIANQTDRVYFGSCSGIVCYAGLGSSIAASVTEVDNSGLHRDLALWPVSACDRFSDDYNDGTSSGSWYIKNNLQVKFTVATDSVAARYIDTVVFIRRNLVLRADGIVANNSY